MKQAVFVILLVLNSFVFAGYMFCAVGYDGEFIHIDPSTGQVDLIYTNTGYLFQALAKSSDGTMYVATTDSSIHVINPQTGDVGDLVAQWSGSFRGMAVSPDGQIYVSTSYYFYAYDSQLGFARNLGRLIGTVNVCQGLAFSPDGVLYGITPSKLITIDLNTLNTSIVGSFSNTDGVGQSLVFTEDGSLYAIGENTFAQLDPIDGSIIGEPITLSGDFRGLELIPEPATVCFFGFGFYYIAGKRKSTEKMGY